MPNTFKLHFSGIYFALLLVVYSVALLLVFILFTEVWVRILLALILLCALVYYLCRDVWLLLPSSYIAIRLAGDNIVLLKREGGEISGQLAHDSLVTPALTILNIVPVNKRGECSVVIFPDSMDKARFRELRVMLKWSDGLV